MDIDGFLEDLKGTFTDRQLYKPTWYHDFPVISRFLDSCSDIEGLASIKKQKLLNLACKHLPEDECYLEVGAYQGKTLIAAMLDNKQKKAFTCDIFLKEIHKENLLKNIKKHKLQDNIVLYHSDFLEIFAKEKLPLPVGVYFYDGGHEEESHYLAIKRVEPFLSKKALVMIDDWGAYDCTDFRVKQATERAISESSNKWRLLYDLPARFNGDKKMWWNGLAVFSFERS